MSQNVSDFRWNAQREEAAFLLADGRLTDDEIAERSGVSRRQITRWKEHKEFADRVAQHVETLARDILTRGIAKRINRIKALNDRWQKMQRVIEERAADPSLAEVPGGQTGMIVHDVKGVGKGDDFQLIDVYSVDTGLLNELRQHEKQAAQELGQWVEKQAQTDPSGEKSHDGITIDARLVLIAALNELGLTVSAAGQDGKDAPARPLLAGASAADDPGKPAPGPVAGEGTGEQGEPPLVPL